MKEKMRVNLGNGERLWNVSFDWLRMEYSLQLEYILRMECSTSCWNKMANPIRDFVNAMLQNMIESFPISNGARKQ